MLVWFVFVAMILMGLADIYLLIKMRETISQRYHGTFPQWIDIIIMIAVLVCVWIFLGMNVFTGVMAGTILGHLCWHEGV